MLTLFSLNNPLTAPIMIMCAAFVLGGGVASVAFLWGRRRYLDRRVQEYAKEAVATRDAQLRANDEQIIDLKERNTALKVKIAHIALNLGKAITHAEIDG